MSLADELLNSIMAEETGDEDPHIVVGIDRFIEVPESLRRIAVQGDHNARTVTFDCPRYCDGRDLSGLLVRVNYTRSDGVTGSYKVDNVRVDDNDDCIIHFDWTITRNATMSFGKLIIQVCAVRINNAGIEELHWNSERNEQISVSEGMECCTGDIPEQYPDVVTQLLDEQSKLDSMVNGVVNELDTVATRVERLEYVAQGSLYKDIEVSAVGKKVTLPANLLPYGSITSVGGASYLRIRNVLPFPYALGTMAEYYNGVFREVHPDGSFTINGVATSEMRWYLISKSMKWVTEPGKYFFSGCPNGGSLDSFYLETAVHKNDNFLAKWEDTGNGTACDTSGLDYNQQTFCFVIKAGARFDNVTFYPQLELGDAKTDFEPFSLKSATVKYITVRGRNRAMLQPFKDGDPNVEIGDNYFVVKKNGSAYYATFYIDGLTPGGTYTLFLKTDIPPDQYGMYPNLSLNNDTQLRFSSDSVFRKVFTARSNGARDKITVYFNGATKLTATTYIEVLEGDVAASRNSFAPAHADYTYEVPEYVTRLAEYGHGINASSESGSTLRRYNYVNFDEKAYYQSVFKRPYASGDESDWRCVTDGVETIYIDNDGKSSAVDVSAVIPDDGVIVPLVDGDSIVFSTVVGEELPMPVSYTIKYQIKV